ncbi:ribosomal-processing cysteine protease Prp [Pediococcus argentinicus]|uniref:Ribosomal processing cysteine protease Prp n=1 Tax=Pediococcus argentinicus TaxID=480391 RepID=A0A0R2NHC3_9LACO|nr:ribosomal-processing cysteine protease Prp [Pediococcus argentinicus]KRO25190.1 hypothetical protein IV88_GL000417 [Pediococcus argentinicus]NKZ22448.1 ribosomal-processing cysteine protease Prp [Pediococcus argentinicus]GEP19548.1 hypothetical protein LSA03_09320 [Pediococcus argentinicus]
MIQAWISKQDGQINGFKLTGHANSGEYGQDIVCAAISVLSINTVNSIEKLTPISPKVVSNNQEGGYMEVSVPDAMSPEAEQKVQLILSSFELGMKDISQSYGEYINLN